MRQGVKTAVTLGVLLVLLLVGAAVGWSQLTAPVEGPREQQAQGPCADTRIRPGDPVRPGMVTVSVFNAGTRSGLAGNTLAAFVNRGFGAGQSGNADPDVSVKRAQVWTTDKQDPAAQLVRRHLGPKRSKLVVKRPAAIKGVGVMVVVGNDFDKLPKGPKRVRSKITTTICSPLPSPDAG